MALVGGVAEWRGSSPCYIMLLRMGVPLWPRLAYKPVPCRALLACWSSPKREATTSTSEKKCNIASLPFFICFVVVVVVVCGFYNSLSLSCSPHNERSALGMWTTQLLLVATLANFTLTLFLHNTCIRERERPTNQLSLPNFPPQHFTRPSRCILALFRAQLSLYVYLSQFINPPFLQQTFFSLIILH